MARKSNWTKKTKHNGEIDQHSGKRVWQISVKPIKDPKQLNELVNELRSESETVGERNALIFKFGVNTGLRCSDILHLRRDAVVGQTQTQIVEQKTHKTRILYFDKLLADIITYNNHRTDDSEWLFPSSKDYSKPLSESTFYQAISHAADQLGMTSVGTHTMRKTFGYLYYKRTQDIALLMQIFNHSSPTITLRYIGMDEERIKRSLKDFDPFSL